MIVSETPTRWQSVLICQEEIIEAEQFDNLLLSFRVETSSSFLPGFRFRRGDSDNSELSFLETVQILVCHRGAELYGTSKEMCNFALVSSKACFFFFLCILEDLMEVVVKRLQRFIPGDKRNQLRGFHRPIYGA